MEFDFKKHPSDIARAAHDFLDGLNVKNKSKHYEVLQLFFSYLMRDFSNCEESDSGELLVIVNWHDFYGGVIDNFINIFMVRNVMSDAGLRKKSVSVMRQFIKWSYKKQFFDQEHFDEYLDAFAASSNQEIDRLEKLTSLFYRLHSPNPGAWARGEVGQVESINDVAEPEEIEEGYMTFKSSKGLQGFFNTFEDNVDVGPVMLSKEILQLLKSGDIVNLTAGRYGNNWRVLETGNVYAAGTGAFQ